MSDAPAPGSIYKHEAAYSVWPRLLISSRTIDDETTWVTKTLFAGECVPANASFRPNHRIVVALAKCVNS